MNAGEVNSMSKVTSVKAVVTAKVSTYQSFSTAAGVKVVVTAKLSTEKITSYGEPVKLTSEKVVDTVKLSTGKSIEGRDIWVMENFLPSD